MQAPILNTNAFFLLLMRVQFRMAYLTSCVDLRDHIVVLRRNVNAAPPHPRSLSYRLLSSGQSCLSQNTQCYHLLLPSETACISLGQCSSPNTPSLFYIPPSFYLWINIIMLFSPTPSMPPPNSPANFR